MSKLLNFTGRVVLITGAGGGLGREYALAFAARGASVVVNDLGGDAKGEGKSRSLADVVVGEIRANGGTAEANYESVENGEELVKKALEAFGRIDILVNNAGILRDRSFARLSDQDWDLIHRVHLRGSFLVTRAAWPHMKKQGYGRIIMTSSTSGVFGNFGQANYSAAKLGLLGLSNTLAIEGAKHDIYCNTIVPIAASRLTKSIFTKEMYDMLSPAYVAPFVVYLCHESCEESGGVFSIAGGSAAQLRWQQSQGACLLSGDQDITPEMVRDNWSDITSWSKSSNPKNSSETLAALNFGDSPKKASQLPSAKTIKHDFSYTFKDVIQYALGVGVTVKEDYSHLKFLYEGHEDFSVLPSFAVIPAQQSLMETIHDSGGKFQEIKIDPSKVVHGEQYLELYRPLSPNATLQSTSVLVDVLDKEKGALFITNVETSDEKGPVCFNQIVAFAIGSGGFGGKRHSEHLKPLAVTPTRAPDVVEVEQTTTSQAALYRLSGDLNPLHIDPSFAAMGGFNAPILHGLCSFGYAIRHVLKHFCNNDVSKFKAVKVRFSKPVLPGQTIRTEMWKDQNRVLLQCKVVETGSITLSGAYVELHGGVNIQNQINHPAQSVGSSLESDALFQLMAERLPSYPDLAKKIKASFLWRITCDGKVKSEWTTDFTKDPGLVHPGKPSGKPNCTVTIADKDFVKTAMGQTSPQKLFMQGKVKIAGNIMLAQKLQTLMKEIDLKQESAKLSKKPPQHSSSSPESDLKSKAVFDELGRRLASMPDLAKKIQASYLWNVTKNGKTAGQWLVDLKTGNGVITAGAPASKPDCTLTVSDEDLVQIISGKANAQQLFMKGKLKVAGNIMLTQKLGELLKSQAKL